MKFYLLAVFFLFSTSFSYGMLEPCAVREVSKTSGERPADLAEVRPSGGSEASVDPEAPVTPEAVSVAVPVLGSEEPEERIEVVVLGQELPADLTPPAEGVRRLGPKKAKLLLGALNGLIGVSASSMYIVSRATGDRGLYGIGPGLFGANFLIDFLTSFPGKVKELRNSRFGLKSACTICDWIGHATATAGFVVLSSGHCPEIGSWLVAGGVALKGLSLGIQCGAFGFEKVFENRRTARNVAFRVILIPIGGTLGAFLIGAGVDPAGAYVIGSSVFAGSWEGVISDLQALSKECHTLENE